jgi:hypothetical protein
MGFNNSVTSSFETFLMKLEMKTYGLLLLDGFHFQLN